MPVSKGKESIMALKGAVLIDSPDGSKQVVPVDNVMVEYAQVTDAMAPTPSNQTVKTTGMMQEYSLRDSTIATGT